MSRPIGIAATSTQALQRAAQAHEDLALSRYLDAQDAAEEAAQPVTRRTPLNGKWMGIGMDAIGLLLSVKDGSYATSSEAHEAWLDKVDALLARAGVHYG